MEQRQVSCLIRLHDAHAMEVPALTMIRSLLQGPGNSTDLMAGFRQYPAQTEGQERRWRTRIVGSASNPSLLKNIAAKTTANGHSLTGIFSGDGVAQSGLATSGFGHTKIAARQALIGAAEVTAGCLSLSRLARLTVPGLRRKNLAAASRALRLGTCDRARKS